MILGRWKTVGSLAMAAALAACSGSDGPQGPGAMLADNTCAQLRADLNGMDKRGVPNMIDARNSGKKLGAQQDAEVNRYNQVLDQYLGGQCASEVRYKQKAGIPQSPPSSGRQASRQDANLTTGSIPKTQAKRRKPSDDDDQASAPSEKTAVYEEQTPAKPARRKTTKAASTQGSDPAKDAPATATATPAAAAPAEAPAPTSAKADSGLPAAPAPVKAEGGEKKE